MTGHPLPLTQILHMLPAHSRDHLALLGDLCTGVVCRMTGESGEPRFSLEADVETRTLRTGSHRQITPALVDELSDLVSAHLGRVI